MKDKRTKDVRRCVCCGEGRATVPYKSGSVKGLWIHVKCAQSPAMHNVEWSIDKGETKR